MQRTIDQLKMFLKDVLFVLLYIIKPSSSQENNIVFKIEPEVIFEQINPSISMQYTPDQ